MGFPPRNRGMMIASTAVLQLLAVLGVVRMIMASDPDPLQDYCVTDTQSSLSINGFACKASVSSADFSSTLLSGPKSTANALGISVTLAGGANFGGLNTQGLSVARLDYAVGGLVPPHVHPRASEVLFVLKGKIYAGFVTGSNQLFAQTLKPFDLFVFPRGLVHFSVNVGNHAALSISGLNSQTPGLSLIANALFASNGTIPDFILEKALKLTQEEVDKIKAAFNG